MINIVFEGMSEGIGGKETYIINVFRELDKKTYQCYFISYEDEIAYEKELREKGAIIVPITPRSSNPFKFIIELNRFFKKTQVDVLWAHKTTLSSCESLQIAKRHNVKVRMIHSHCSENMGNRFTQFMHDLNKKRIDKNANVLIACSDVASKYFYDNRKSIILANAIKLTKFRYNSLIRNKIRNELRLDNDIVLGHVGRFSVEKNHEKLLRVFGKFHEQIPNSSLILCGDGPERNKIEKLIKELGIEENVRLLGRVGNVEEILQAMDIMVMPSLFEGLPFALIEAQAAGLRCVVSDTISPESNILGWNVAVGLDAPEQEWVDAILSINITYDRDEGYIKLKEKGFDLEDSISSVEDIISKVTKKK